MEGGTEKERERGGGGGGGRELLSSGERTFDHLLIQCAGISITILSTLLLAFNVSIPNELKGFFFYAQVCHSMYMYM